MTGSCGMALTGHWRAEPLPEPVLKRVEADEARVRRQQQVLMAAVLGPLPSELHRIDENQACWPSSTDVVVRDRFSGEADDLRERSPVQRDRRRRIEFGWGRSDEGKVLARVVADRHRDAGCDRQLTH